jgi:glutaminyl-tRNA synthetase
LESDLNPIEECAEAVSASTTTSKSVPSNPCHFPSHTNSPILPSIKATLPPAKYFRLSPGNMVRLKGAYIIKCEEVVENEDGSIKELHCSYVPSSKSGADESGIKVKGVIQWVSATEGIKSEIRIYDRLFKVEDPTSEEGDFKEYINENSLEILTAYVEPILKEAKQGDRYQFMRNGYFVPDADSSTENLIFNKTVGLKEGFKIG